MHLYMQFVQLAVLMIHAISEPMDTTIILHGHKTLGTFLEYMSCRNVSVHYQVSASEACCSHCTLFGYLYVACLEYIVFIIMGKIWL